MGEIIGTIVFGAVIGALARFFMKGEQNIGMIWTIILGALGAGLANWFLESFWSSAVDTPGVDWIRWIVSIIFAVILISIYLSVTNKKK